MTLDELRVLIAGSPWANYASALEPYVKPAVRMRTQKVAAPLATGVSRFGGDPDFPIDWSWPVWAGKPERDGSGMAMAGGPLAFLCQINMADFPKTPFTRPLPGILYVFYEARDQIWGFDPLDRGSWKLLHYTGPMDRLQRHPAPDTEARFDECAVTFEVTFGLPTNAALLERPAQISEDLWAQLTDQAYFDLLVALHADSPQHLFGGYAQPIQGDDMAEECACTARGIYCGDATQFDHPDFAQACASKDSWAMLLQIDTDEDGPGWMWGDGGRLYFWCPKAEMAQFNFTNAWCIAQCF
jgi:uncharacterized protein YwqG